MTTHTEADRFWAKVEKTETCWHWTGTIHRSGYGLIKIEGRQVYAHRFAYEAAHGVIPAGLNVDHVCHNEDTNCPGGAGCQHRRCVNPAHLEAVTQRENTLRGRSPAADCAKRTHCPQGHPYSAENTAIHSNGRNGARVCKTCMRAKDARRSADRRLRNSAQPTA